MKRKEVIALLLVGSLLSGVVAVAATEDGAEANPLITLNWLKNTFIPDTETQIKDHTDQQLDHLLSAEKQGVELRVKGADILKLESGSTLMLLAGGGDITVGTGTVVDTTTGEELLSGGVAAAADHRYVVAEDSSAEFSVTSDTAVVRITGAYQHSSSENTDYNAIADALKGMGLFQGSDVPYGSGYELESAPTRIQGLIMFLRLMGEEQYALAYPGSGITFADVPDWAEPYVAYAYDKGYTKGQEIDSQWRVVFGTQDLLAPRDYMTFLLRALDYAEGTDFQWLTAIEDARSLGILTDGEVAELTEKPFLRAQVAYLSYFALSAKTPGGESLAQRLSTAGALDATLVDASMLSLGNQRL